MPLWHLVVHETANHVRRARVRLLALSAALLAVAVVSVGIGDYRFRYSEYLHGIDVREVERHKSSLYLTGWSTESALRAFRRPSVGSIFVRGVDAVLPAYSDFGPSGVTSGPLGASLRQQSGAGSFLDLEESVRLVLGFLAFMLSTETFAHDRTNGSLRALMAQPIKPSQVLAGKVLAAGLTLAGAIALLWVAAVITMWAEARDLLSADVLQFLAEFSVASCLYLGVIFVGGLAINLLARTYSTTVTVGTVVWFFIVFLAPQLASVGASVAAPVRSAKAVESDREILYAGRLRLTQQFLGEAAFRLLGNQAQTVDEKLYEREGREIDRLWIAEASETRRLLDAIDDRSAQEVSNQTRIKTWLSLASPATVFMDLAAELADTGAAAEARWVKDVGGQQRLLESRLFDDRAKLTMYVPTRDRAQAIVSFDRHPLPSIGDIPDFHASVRSPQTRLFVSRTHIAVLLCYGIILFAIVGAAFPRFSL